MLRVAESTSGSLRSGNDCKLGILDRIRNQAEVHDVARHVVIHLVGAAVLDVDVDRRITFHELRDIRGQFTQADAVNRRNADIAGDDVLQLLQFAVGKESWAWRISLP